MLSHFSFFLFSRGQVSVPIRCLRAVLDNVLQWITALTIGFDWFCRKRREKLIKPKRIAFEFPSLVPGPWRKAFAWLISFLECTSRPREPFLFLIWSVWGKTLVQTNMWRCRIDLRPGHTLFRLAFYDRRERILSLMCDDGFSVVGRRWLVLCYIGSR